MADMLRESGLKCMWATGWAICLGYQKSSKDHC